jgi:hypothetical protein
MLTPAARTNRFRELIETVAGRLGGAVERCGEDEATLRAPLPKERFQRVYLRLDGDTIRYATQCSSWLSDLTNPNLFKTLLQKNYELSHGFFALNPDGGVELVDTQLLETADAEEVYVCIVNLATVGDFMERELGRDRDTDVF